MRIVLPLIFIGILFIVPDFAAAQQNPLVPNCDVNCKWGDLIQLGKNILDIIVTLAIIVSAIMFAYAGFLMLSDRGSTKNLGTAKAIFGHVVVGLIIVLTSWLIINTILDVLTGRGLDERGGKILQINTTPHS